MAEIVPLPGIHRHNQPGYFSLAQLPQRASIAEHAIGTGWWELDQIFKFYLGQFVVVTGIAGQGKSTFLLNVLCNIARLHAVKSFMYVPENEGHLRDKLQKIWNHDPSFNAYADGQCFVQSATPDDYDARPKTLDWVLNKAVVAIERDQVEVVLIDPWNELERAKPREMLMTDYIGECLMMLKQFCRKFNVVVIVVAHPTKAVNEHGGRIPGLADIEGCYSDDTEVLTRRGWLHHGQVTLSDDVACFAPATGNVEYHQPSNVLRKGYAGEMVHCLGYGYDLLVTPQHRMLVKPAWSEPVGLGSLRGRPVVFPKGQWTFAEAGSLPGSAFTIPLGGRPIDGADPAHVVIGGRSYPAEAFWRLVGWYVAEGYIGPTGLTWSQAEGELAETFTQTFAEAGIPASVGWQQPHGKGRRVTGRWYVGNRYCPDLVSWFRSHCGEGAARKRIPSSAFELSPRLKRILLTAYLEGDGSDRGGRYSAVTISAGLRDDLQRLAVEVGMSTGFSVRPAIEKSQEAYTVSFNRESRREVALRASRNVTTQKYDGLVWCLTVPTGAYFVRRNGKVAVCGNSMNWFNKCDNGLIVVRDPEKNTSQVISAKVRETGAGKRGSCHFFVDPETGIYTPQQGGFVAR